MTYRADIGDEVYRDRDREVYVEREGMSIGTIVGIVLAVIVVLAIVWFFFLGGMNTGGNTTPNDNQNNVTIDQPANQNPGGGQPAY
jgi:hypothetical protein